MRLFFAVALPDAVRERLAALIRELRAKAPDGAVSWVAPENLHLTLRFLGDVTDPGPVVEAGRDAAANVAPFALALEGLGTFGGRASPRVVWVGVRKDAGHDAVATLAKDLERRARALGFEPEAKGFSAHVTLARVRREAKPKALRDLAAHIEAQRSFAGGDVPVREFVLFESRLRGGRPPEYVPNATFELRNQVNAS